MYLKVLFHTHMLNDVGDMTVYVMFKMKMLMDAFQVYDCWWKKPSSVAEGMLSVNGCSTVGTWGYNFECV